MSQPRRARRHDPERRDRIVDACLDVIGEVGVAGTSARRIAAAADVPLGSVTYHFASVDELLLVAFERFAREVSDRFEQRMSSAGNVRDACGAIVDLIAAEVPTDPRELVLTHELYTLAARDPGFRQLTHDWMARSRRALERHFDPSTARILDALIEGLSIHRALETEARPVDDIVRAVARITGTPPAPPRDTPVGLRPGRPGREFVQDGLGRRRAEPGRSGLAHGE